MKEYLVVTVVKGSLGNAGPKAPLDICRILEKTGKVDVVSLAATEGTDFPVFLKLYRILNEARERNRKVILQYPLQPHIYHDYQACYADLFQLLDTDKTTILMHDVNQIRFTNCNVYLHEMQWLKPFHHFIVHNEFMEQYLRKYLEIDTCIKNEIFDYLCDGQRYQGRESKLDINAPTIVFAGNLDASKAPFLYDLQAEKMRFYMNVYGRRVALIKNVKIYYCGSFQADALPGRLRGDMGLIWDGIIDGHLDRSAQKNYTRYNTPHKFSCYIAAGIPVIAWKEAAIAKTVEKYQVGYLIDNLYEINDLDFSIYPIYKRNAEKLSEKVRNGYFTKKMFESLIARDCQR